MASVLDEFRSAAEKIEQEAATKLKELRDSSRSKLTDEKKSLEKQIKALYSEADKKAKPLEKQLEEVESHLRNLSGRRSGSNRRRRGGRGGGPTNRDKIMEFVRANPGAAKQDIVAGVDVKESVIPNLLSSLKKDGTLRTTGKQGSYTYTVS